MSPVGLSARWTAAVFALTLEDADQARVVTCCEHQVPLCRSQGSERPRRMAQWVRAQPEGAVVTTGLYSPFPTGSLQVFFGLLGKYLVVSVSGHLYEALELR